MNKNLRSSKLDNVKWILTLLIVLYHIQYQGLGGTEEVVFTYIKNLGDSVVPAFSLISGYLFFSNVKDLNCVKLKMKRRIFSLLVPYLFWNLIHAGYINFFIEGKRGISVFDINLYQDLINWTSSPHFWYIFMLMFWTLLAPVLYFAYNDKRLLIVLILAQIVYLIYKGDTIYHSRFIYLLYTWGGFIGIKNIDFAEYYRRIGKHMKVLILAAVILCFIALGYLTMLPTIGMEYKVWLYAVRAISLIFIALNLPLLFVGKHTNYRFSFWIFASHYWLDSLVSGIIVKLQLNVLLYQIVTWIVVFTIAISTGLLLDKISPIIFRILTGNRDSIKMKGETLHE